MAGLAAGAAWLSKKVVEKVSDTVDDLFATDDSAMAYERAKRVLESWPQNALAPLSDSDFQRHKRAVAAVEAHDRQQTDAAYDESIMPYEEAKRVFQSMDAQAFLKATPVDRQRYARALASIDLQYRRDHGLSDHQPDIELANLKGQTVFDMSPDNRQWQKAWDKVIGGAQHTAAEFDAALRRRGTEPPRPVQPDWMVCPRCRGNGTDPVYNRNYLGYYQAYPCSNCGGSGQVHNPAAGQPY
ncbi:MAG: hypothetical protein JO007_23300 [Alphaproteobacteria bacterium]|nr:hypothetical protein [Alphaproteobacteria bacterium]